MEKEIRSAQHPYIKYLTLLRKEKKARQKHGALLISGEKLIEDLSLTIPFKTLLVEENTPLPPSLRAKEVLRLPFSLLKKITGLAHPEPLAAEISFVLPPPPKKLQRLLVLDRLQDPGNLGTLLRTALGLAWDAVFLLDGTVDPFNDKALRASQGAALILPLMEGSYAELLSCVKTHHLVLLLADSRGKNCREQKTPGPLALVLGSEGGGIDKELSSLGEKIKIPIFNIESLNVGVAGGILMYELGPHD